MNWPPEPGQLWTRLTSSRKTLAAASIAALTLVVVIVSVAPRVGQLISGRPNAAATTVNCVAPQAKLPHSAGDFKPGFIYQVMLDRFFNGDTSNDNPVGAKGLNDPTHQNWKLYWGGDLKGLTQKIPYIAGMGATAIWISPPVQNISTPIDYGDGNGPQAGYHGYWANDDYRIDPHLGTWADFDAFVAAAHKHGVQVMVDFPANDSNPRDTGQKGAIYQDGVLKATYANDTNGWYHHNPTITNYDDPYDLEYGTLADLADFAQENPAVDTYLKGAIAQFMSHGVDGIRFDAAKHMPGATGGWLRTVADGIESSGPHYLIGEWQVTDPTDLTYPGAVRFANNSGISLLNFAVMNAIDDAYARGKFAGPAEVDSVLQTEQHDLTWPNDQANFIDNHDFQRFLSINNNHNDLHSALAVDMTIPGIPVVYYGSEQYLRNDTLGGGDPYNRPMMAQFDTTTPAYQLIRCLSTLRQSNPALPFGNYTLLHLSHSLFVYQRQFGKSAVIVAVNAANDPAMMKSGPTALPAGTYRDYLAGAYHGVSLTVGADGTTKPTTLPANGIAVWQYDATTPTTPQIGSVGPELTHAGESLTIDGQGFAAGATVKIGQYAASVSSATSDSITAKVPAMPGGAYQVTVCVRGACSSGYALNVASAPQVPVNITVSGLPQLASGQHVYITGTVPELGAGATAPNAAIGPMLSAQLHDTSMSLLISLPACQTISLSFETVDLSGQVTPEHATHSLTTPCSGEAVATYTWGH
ncbi:MAG TPA: alpha-amylase family glycosyl hydrolase [Ktedonobacterales bacterium]